ncbi:hypothetical protein DAKH74_020140 [Maudiozyma humilis]|uniref:Retrovirus-related Pol polyprotein from transposon TNT 1-94-like beta-barrel domain-containing protein n=1 Tax=Maudiozyma humilis TaxID=51915 RepID=A0AAV5RVC7_MAUHU|nr:hypothetical protein DAKH74_020140 [Kazachstania humilis]
MDKNNLADGRSLALFLRSLAVKKTPVDKKLLELLKTLNEDEGQRLITKQIHKFRTIELLLSKSTASDISEYLIIDSGANQIIIGNKDMLINMQPIQLNINGIDGTKTTVGTHIGTVLLKLEDETIIRIDDAIYAPSARGNVLATDVFTRLGYSLMHDADTYSVTHDNITQKIAMRLWNKLYACDLNYFNGQKIISLKTPPLLDMDVLLTESGQI